MSEVEIFLNMLARASYPSNKTSSIARTLDYNLDNFLVELVEQFGEQKAMEFIKKTFSKLFRNGVFCHDLVGYVQTGGNVCLVLNKIIPHVDHNELEFKVNWGPSKILDENGNSKTIQQIIDDADMSEWSEVDSFIEMILKDISDELHKMTGFNVTFDK